ncbi:MAG: flagellar hook-length control protein FliK [Burkholderiaceae bacterium]|nr:flagellar hook-length control protein FliK [Burkholderiaceae bacterium]
MNEILLPATAATPAAAAPGAAAEVAPAAAPAFEAVMARYAKALHGAALAGTADGAAAEDGAPSDAASPRPEEGEAAAPVASAVLTDLSAAAGLVAAAVREVPASSPPAQDAPEAASEADALQAPVPRPMTRPLTTVESAAADGRLAPRAAAEKAAAPTRMAATTLASPEAAASRDAAQGAAAPGRTGVPEPTTSTAPAPAPAMSTAPGQPLAAPPVAAPASPAFSFAHASVPAPVGSAAFAEALAQRVVLFAGRKVQQAELSVSPADLGPIAVQIEVRGQEATLAFAAASHATRQAIEEALPRLREMFAAQGLQLAGAEVNDQPRRESARGGAPAAVRGRSERAAAEALAVDVALPTPRRPRGVIDIVV